MKEVQWRSKLIQLFRKANPDSFIWAMDAKFKAGFPDLYLVHNGKSFHYELKVARYPIPSFSLLAEFFAPIQLSVMRQINKSGGIARGLILNTDGYVYLRDFTRDNLEIFNPVIFNQFWVGPQVLEF